MHRADKPTSGSRDLCMQHPNEDASLSCQAPARSKSLVSLHAACELAMRRHTQSTKTRQIISVTGAMDAGRQLPQTWVNLSRFLDSRLRCTSAMSLSRQADR